MVVFNHSFNYIDLLPSTRASGNSTDFPELLRGMNGNIETIFIKRLVITLEQVHSNTETTLVYLQELPNSQKRKTTVVQLNKMCARDNDHVPQIQEDIPDPGMGMGRQIGFQGEVATECVLKDDKA